MYHKPVLLNEAISGLNIRPDGIYVDVTFGGGGHSAEILKRLKKGRLLAFDRDADAQVNRIGDERFLLLHNNYRYLKNFLKLHQALPVDGILADLGVSSHQFDVPQKGFSTRFEGLLDMRMDSRSDVTAGSIINSFTKEKLMEIFFDYGEVYNAAKLADRIIAYRNNKTIATTSDLKEAIASCIDKKAEARYLAKVFQALRIEVNQELEALKEMLQQSLSVLKSGGRLVVISYHSLEDRLVKNFFKSGNFSGTIEKDFYGVPQVPFRLITRKAIIPGEQEISENNRARSAKLRIAEKY